jgi:hypothetical protein
LPVCAATWVIPCPINPAPRTAILLISMITFHLH